MQKRILGLILSFVLASSIAFPAYASNSPAIIRLAGDDRYAASSAIAQQWGQSDYAVLACGSDFPDALSAAPLAKKYNAPILLTTTNNLPDTTKQTLTGLNVKNVFIIGGTGIISANVENQLNSMHIQTVRIYGEDRYDTSVKIAKQLDTPTQLVVCTGNNFSDALSMAPIAAIKQLPIVLVPKNFLPDSTREYISSLNGVIKTYVIGDSSIISDSIVDQLPNAERITGSNKYSRNVAINQKFDSTLGKDKVCLATGEDFADALTGAVFAAEMSAPIILVRGVTPNETRSYYWAGLSDINTIYVLGSPDNISDNFISNLGNRQEEIRLSETYLYLFIDSNSLEYEWESPAEIEEKNQYFSWFYLFEDIYYFKMGGRLEEFFETKPGGWVVVPISTIQKTLSQYFDGITREMIIDSSQSWYDKELDAVVYGGGRGSRPYSPSVISYEVKDQILTIDYILRYDYDEGAIANDAEKYRLTIELKPNGSYRYLSNKQMQ